MQAKLGDGSHDKHLKSEYRLGKNCLEGSVGDAHNTLVAGMDFNLMLLIREFSGNCLTLILWALYALIQSRQLCRVQSHACSRDGLSGHDYFLATFRSM